MIPIKPDSRMKKMGWSLVLVRAKKSSRNSMSSFSIEPVNTVC